jgi:hypothetical protein
MIGNNDDHKSFKVQAPEEDEIMLEKFMAVSYARNELITKPQVDEIPGLVDHDDSMNYEAL